MTDTQSRLAPHLPMNGPDQSVEAAKEFILSQSPPIKAAPPEDALDPDQATDYHRDEAYRAQERDKSGQVSAFEGVVVAEKTDPDMKKMLLDWEADKASREASTKYLMVLRAFDQSLAVRCGYWLHQERAKASEQVERFMHWLRS
jgi:hypothetical protein